MITIDEKMFITKDVNRILVNYAKNNVLKELLTQFSFDKLKPFKKPKDVSDLLKSVSYDENSPESKSELLEFIWSFLKTQERHQITALYFWLIDRKYFDYREETGLEDKDQSLTFHNFLAKFGRELAYKLYDPDGSELDQELEEELKTILMAFADEFDLSLVDKDTIQHVLDMVDYYSR